MASPAGALRDHACIVRPRINITSTALNGLFVQYGGMFFDHEQVRYRSNRSRRGLYDGKDIRSGNNRSFSMRATKRTFKPNVFLKRVYSEILGSMIKFHLTSSTLRSIDKAGGLDNYLLNNDSITEGEGFVIRRKILKKLKNKAKRERMIASMPAGVGSVVVDA